MLVECHNCSVSFNKTPSEIRKSKSGKHYCSRSCSAQYNNKGVCRNQPTEHTCSSCSAEFTCTGKHRSRTYCSACLLGYGTYKEMQRSFYESLTVGEYRSKASVEGKHPSWRHAHIRNLNRSWNKSMTLLPCRVCGYDKHVELAHIKGLSSFGDEATLGEINSPENVIQLCRNCHWELDNGLIKLV